METTRDNLRFSLESWPEAGLTAQFALAPSTLSPYLEEAMARDDNLVEGGAPQLVSAMKGSLRLQLFGRRLRVAGVFAVRVELACHRCLAVFVHKLSDQFEELVDLIGPGEETEEAELAVVTVDNQFDLTPLLVEQMWLAWPIKVLCRPDCLGLCLNCGANLNEGLCSCGRPLTLKH